MKERLAERRGKAHLSRGEGLGRTDLGRLRLDKTGAGQDLALHWNEASNADDYLVFEEAAPGSAFIIVVGTAQDGAHGWTTSMLAGSVFFLVAARNSACGLGPKR